MTTPLDSSTHNAGTSLTTSHLHSSPDANTNFDPASQPHQPHSFPPPQTFTFLPQLYNLISHLTPLQPSSQQTSTPGASAPASTTNPRASRSPTLTRRLPDQQSQSQSQPPTTDPNTTGTLSLIPTRSRDKSIDPKDLPALVYPLRQQIAQAKAVVAGLPDIERSVEMQEQDIRELEARIEALKDRVGVLAGLAKEGGGGVEDVVMVGVEGR